MEQKLMVISSQYYWQHMCFVVDADLPDHELHARLCQMVAELEQYKRATRNMDPPRFGDIDSKYWRGFMGKERYNINDHGGDFYIFCVNSVNAAMDVVEAENSEKYNSKSQFTKKDLMKIQISIDEHHNKRKVSDIVRNYFTLA